MSDLDEIRRKRMEQLQQQMQQQSAGPNLQQMQQQQQMKEQMEKQKKDAIRQILSPEARQRLSNLRLTKAELVEGIEMELIQLAQSGRMKIPVSDDQLKQILMQATGNKREIHITRR